MIWFSMAVFLCAALCYLVIKKIERINMLVSSQCLDIFNLKQAFDEFQKDSEYRLTEWGKELKVCILSLQADVLRNGTESSIKKVIEEKATRTRKPPSEEAKKKAAERRRLLRAKKREEMAKATSPLDNQTATLVEGSSNDSM